ncbi:outer membrane protein [Hyphomicrobium sp. 2TAF46]|uniref:outer membrane protein n=1 Tax=Hyphomicrobium sp. 2TAF46 TaxID=3233019 RepID=UPI003F90717E
MTYRTKRLLVGIAVLGLCGTGEAAHAADLGGAPRRGPSNAFVDQTPVLWQGLYMGLMIGATASGVDVEKFGKKDKADIDGASVGFGTVAGYNFGNGPWLFGFEADVNSGGFDDKKSIAGLGTLSAEANWFGSLRFRAGYTWDRMMIYGTAGLAIADLDIKSSLGGKDSVVATGLAVGLGTEYAIDENWRGRAEGLLYAISDEDVKLAGSQRDVTWGHATFRLGLVRGF